MACKLESPRLYITGDPGVGKTTIFFKVVEDLRRLGCRVGGFYAPEVRVSGSRVGFKIVNLATGEEGWLARVGARGDIKMGRYTIVEDDAIRVGVGALERAVRESQVVAIDEIGPMELSVSELKASIVKAIKSGKLYLAVVHRRLSETHPDIYRALVEKAPVVRVTVDNRGAMLGCAPQYARIIASTACSQPLA